MNYFATLLTLCRRSLEVNELEENHRDTTLALALLLERARGARSLWHEHIAMLPAEALAMDQNAMYSDGGAAVDGILGGTVIHEVRLGPGTQAFTCSTHARA